MSARETLDGKYALIRVLGRGGMGVVFEAEHLRLKRRCAIKLLSAEMLEEPEIVHRFEREARACALLTSAHVTRVTDVATTPEGVPYLVMELLSGQDLDATLQARGRLPYDEAADYVLQACAGIAEAHRAGIIHRDLKPGNLFIAETPDGVQVKVLDFGISKLLAEASSLTTADMAMGTTLYMSPEQLRSAARVDARADIWSLGVILYELLCGEPPFMGSAPQVAVAIVSDEVPALCKRCEIPPALHALVHRALQRDPGARFQTVADLAAALEQFAPLGSVGRAAAAQIDRASSRRLNLEPPASRPRIDVGAATLPSDAAIGIPRDAATLPRPGRLSRRVTIGLLAFVGLLASAGALHALRSTDSTTAASPASAFAAAPGSPAATVSTLGPTEAAAPTKEPAIRTGVTPVASPASPRASARPPPVLQAPPGARRVPPAATQQKDPAFL